MPRSWRRWMSRQASSIVIGCSGMRMTSAPPGHPAHDRDPARVPAHHLDDHDAVVRLGGRVQPVDRLGGDGQRRVEAERVVGRREVVVDRLGHADDRERVLLEEPRGDAERVLAADGDERVEPLRCEVLEHALDAVLELVRVRPRRAEDRAAARQDPRDRAVVERLELALDEPAPALADADHLVAAVERAPRHRADDRVQTRAVASAGEECNSLAHSLTSATRGRLFGRTQSDRWTDFERGEEVTTDAEGGDRTRTGQSPTGF